MKSQLRKDSEKATRDDKKAWAAVFDAYREGTDTLEMWRNAAEHHETAEMLQSEEIHDFIDRRAGRRAG